MCGMSRRNDMHKNGNSGFPVLLIISLVRLWQVVACLGYISKTIQGNQMEFQTLIASNDISCKTHKPLL